MQSGRVRTLDDHQARLRSEVARLRASVGRRVVDLTVHVGTVGGAFASLVVGAGDIASVDGSLRAEVLSRLIEQRADNGDMVWIWRAGAPALHDLDLAWMSAAVLAFGAHGRTVRRCYAITWTGWLDIRSGESRVWKRLRV